VAAVAAVVVRASAGGGTHVLGVGSGLVRGRSIPHTCEFFTACFETGDGLMMPVLAGGECRRHARDRQASSVGQQYRERD